MKVLLFAHGTRGDVQPFVALASALKRAGHDAVLAATAGSESLAEPFGVKVVPIYDNIKDLISDPAVRAGFETNYRGLRGKRHFVRVMLKSRRLAPPVLQDMASTVALTPDIVVYQLGLPGHEIAERLGVPAVPACLEPTLVPTKSFPNPVLPFVVPHSLNRASFWATRLWIRAFGGDIAKWRRETLLLRNRRGHRNPLRDPHGRATTVLQAFSRHMLPAPSDYPSWVHTTGFWFLPAPSGWTPPQSLCDFIAAGDPPVYVGFGSTVGTDPDRKRHLVLNAISSARARAVVVTGYGGIQPDQSTEDVYFLDQAPFDWLFPRMAAIVHHGGVGTTGAALASGRPQVVCPFIISQRYYASRMHATGVATAPLPQRILTAANLAAAIRHAISDPALSRLCHDLGREVRAEDGVTAAVRVLETLSRR